MNVLSAVYPKSVHVLCLAHIVNLAAEIFHTHHDDPVITFQKAWQSTMKCPCNSTSSKKLPAFDGSLDITRGQAPFWHVQCISS